VEEPSPSGDVFKVSAGSLLIRVLSELRQDPGYVEIERRILLAFGDERVKLSL
jgi:hypothetical protein